MFTSAPNFYAGKFPRSFSPRPSPTPRQSGAFFDAFVEMAPPPSERIADADSGEEILVDPVADSFQRLCI